MPLLPLLLALPPLVQGQNLQIGATLRLPSYGVGSKDHAVVAANANGDLCVVWHAETGVPGQHLVEAAIYHHRGNGRWTSLPEDHLLLGDPALAVWGPNRDTCIKPAVGALEDGSFVAVWPRFDLVTLDGRLEARRIVLDSAGGPPRAEDRKSAQPVVLDPSLRPGDGGAMPSVTGLSGSECLVVYAHETARTPLANGEVLRDYALRLRRFDWSLGPDAPGFLVAADELPWLVPADDTPSAPTDGGLVLPEVVVDEPGKVYVAYEEYRAAGRVGYDDGAVVLLALHASGGALVLDDRLEFRGSDRRRRQRRPQLSAARGDGRDRVLLAWGDRASPGLVHNRARWQGVERTPQGLAATPLPWSPSPGGEDFHPFPVQLPALDLLLASRAFPTSRRLLVGDGRHGSLTELWTQPPYVLRPAAALLFRDLGGPQPTRILAVAYEGSPASAMRSRAVYLQAQRF